MAWGVARPRPSNSSCRRWERLPPPNCSFATGRGPLPAAVLRDVQQVAAGNPRCALELARVGFRLGADGAGPVPQRLRRLVLDRLRDLSGEQRRALLLLAAASRPTVAELRTAVGGEDPLLLLGPALRCGLVELDAGGGVGRVGRVSFGDPLARVVLLAEAAPTELAAARRSLAAAVTDPGERARQLALSRPGESDEQTAAALAAAATRARDRGATSEAYRLARLAVRRTPAAVAPVSATSVPDARADRLLTAAESPGTPAGGRKPVNSPPSCWTRRRRKLSPLAPGPGR